MKNKLDENPKLEKKKSIFAKLNESLLNLKQLFQKPPEKENNNDSKSNIIEGSLNPDTNANSLNLAMMTELNKLKNLMPQTNASPKVAPKQSPIDPFLPIPNFIPVNAPNLNEIKLKKMEEKAETSIIEEKVIEPAKPKTVLEVRKEFLSELKKLKSDMKAQIQEEPEDIEEKQQMAQLKTEFMAELKRLKKNVDEEVKNEEKIKPEDLDDDENLEEW